jgi:hypothetical protein
VTTADVGGARTALRVPLLTGSKLLGHLWGGAPACWLGKGPAHSLLRYRSDLASKATCCLLDPRLANAPRCPWRRSAFAAHQPVASYSLGRVIATTSEPSTGTKLDIVATDQIRPIATTKAIIHASICIPLYVALSLPEGVRIFLAAPM